MSTIRTRGMGPQARTAAPGQPAAAPTPSTAAPAAGAPQRAAATRTAPATPPPAAAPAAAPDVGTVVGQAMERALAPLMEVMRGLATQRTTNNSAGLATSGGEGGATIGDHITGGEHASARKKGLRFVQCLRTLYHANARGQTIEAAARSLGYEHVVRALNQTTAVDGGNLVIPEYAAEIIELLRAATVVLALGARVLPMGSSTMHINKQTGSATASYVGESGPAVPSQPVLGRVTLQEKKLMALVPFTNDLWRNASVAADEFILADIVAALALRSDLAFIRGDGTANTPSGLKTQMAAGNVVNAAAGIAPTLAVTRAELAKVVGKLKEANVQMVTPGWILPPRVETYLWGITDGNGNAIYAAEMAQGRLMGAPYKTTTQIPTNLGAGTNESEIYFADFSHVIIGESLSLLAEVFPNGVYEDAGTTKSGVTRDESVVRAITKHDVGLRQTAAVARLDKVQWGA